MFKELDNGDKIKLIIATLWSVFVAAITPLYAGFIFMFSLEQTKDMSNNINVWIAVIMFILWIVLFVPCTIWNLKKYRKLNRMAMNIVSFIYCVIIIISSILVYIPN